MPEHRPAADVDLSALVKAKGLGEPRATYLPDRQPSWSDRPASSKAGAVIAGAIVLSIVAVLLASAPVFAVILIVILAGMAGIGVVRNRGAAARMQGRELRLFEHGLVNVGVGKQTPAAIRWDEASVLQDITRHVRNGATAHVTYLYKLSCPSGTQTAISGIDGGIGGIERPREWGTEIQRAVTSAQLPGAVAALERGEDLSFGDITVNRDGISARGKSVPWGQLQEIQVKDGYVSLKQAGQWRSLSTTPVKNIANYFVFEALAERMGMMSRP